MKPYKRDRGGGRERARERVSESERERAGTIEIGFLGNWMYIVPPLRD